MNFSCEIYFENSSFFLIRNTFHKMAVAGFLGVCMNNPSKLKIVSKMTFLLKNGITRRFLTKSERIFSEMAVATILHYCTNNIST